MRNTDQAPMRWFSRRVTTLLRPGLLGWTGIVALLAAALSAPAATFFSDFNSGLPAGTAIYGNSTNLASGGYTNSGYLLLTPNVGGQNGGYVLTSDLDAGNPVYGFVARFKAYIGGGGTVGADGISFNFASNLPLGIIGEEGAGSGLTVEFDTYSNLPPTVDSIGIDVKVAGFEYATTYFDGLRQGDWVDVLVQLRPDGTLAVMYDGHWIYTNFSAASYGLSIPYTSGLFGFGARTGGSWDTQAIDNLSIATFTNQAPFVDSYAPIGRAVRPDAPLRIVLTDYVTQVDTNTMALKVDGLPVVATVLTQSPPQTVIQYTPPTFFASGSSHTVSLTFADNSTPTPITNTFAYDFTVATFAILTNPVPASLVSANPGFDLRISQIEANRGASISRAEAQLANLLLDPATGLPYANLATVAATHEAGVINYSTAGGQGDFPTEAANSIPGLPGVFPDTTSSGDTNAALDAVTYLHLPVGVYTLGVNSSDGFRLTAASTPDLYATQEMAYDAIRAAGDSTITFAVTNAGYYPFRICYFVGGSELVAPTADVPSLEFFSVDAVGTKTLINDTSAPGYIAAYRPAQTLSYVRSVNPIAGSTGVPKGSAIDVTLVNGTITVQTGTINMWLNGTAVTPTPPTTVNGITTVHYQPASPLPLNSSNFVQFAFTDSASNRRTNSFYFVVENILTQLFSISPVTTDPILKKWVTSAGTERGIAYNPKTGHVLIVSRNGTLGGTDSTGPNGCGIGVFDGNDGNYISQLNQQLPDTTYITNVANAGTFRVNMIDVAEDGVIYVCNLGSAASGFKVYRWQNESASPTFAINDVLLGGSTRYGDDFCVRGSGAGTQIIASGNSAVSTIPIYTTTDGINFTGIALNVAGLPTAQVRLGLAFGCGNTIYGLTTGSPLRYTSFDGPPSTVSILITNYPILDSAAHTFIGPIGIDIGNQRLIGASTAGTAGAAHSMNLFDLDALLAGVNNSPVDSKPFAVNVGTFGTGSVDFTPDGSRVYTLDTGSGVIAFSLNLRLAAPTICAQPKTNIVAGPGSLGFMDVTAIGAPQRYQWRFNATSATAPGTPILNATNRTLDIFNVQPNVLGFYSVVISNASLATSVTSAVAVLDTQMVVTNQPASQVAAVGGTATFTVGVSNGLAPYSYQWRLNGTNVGANSSAYTVNNAQVTNAGVYTVVITDSLGQFVTSAQAGLTVGTLGNGTGLLGDYYSVQLKTFVDPPTLERLDTTVNFDWGTGSPDPLISADTFTVRWAGLVEPLYSQTYTFYTQTDDGARLWVNGQLLIDKWVDQGNVEWSGTIALTAHQKYPILMEYYENAGGAAAKLSWSSLGQIKQVIPETQLYPVTSYATAAQPSIARTANGTSLTISWAGSYMLLSAPSLEGPWTSTGGTSPYTLIIDPAQPQFFLRLQSQ